MIVEHSVDEDEPLVLDNVVEACEEEVVEAVVALPLPEGFCFCVSPITFCATDLEFC